jgi:hypothetical protein
MKTIFVLIAVLGCAFAQTAPDPWLNALPTLPQSWEGSANENFSGGHANFATPPLRGIATKAANTNFTESDSAASACSVNNVSYVGGSCASVWGGGDIGAQINAAYAAFPSGGGHIHIAAGNYSFSTPVVLLVPSLPKPVTLDCDAGGSGYHKVSGATVLNYAGAGTAVAIAGSIGSQMNGCTLVGPGVRTSTVGLLVGGPTRFNSAILSSFTANNISNFGVGLQFGHNAYIDTFLDNWIHDNGTDGGTHNLYVPAGLAEFGENITFIGGAITNNPTASGYSVTCVDILSSGSLKFYGLSFDQCGMTINATNAVVDLTSDHFENPVYATADDFITLGERCQNCVLNISGGDFYEGAVSARNEFINEASPIPNNSNSISITGTAFSSQEPIPVVKVTGSATCCQRVYVKDYQPGANVLGPFAGTWQSTVFEYAGAYQASGVITTGTGLRIKGCTAGTYAKADGTGCGPVAAGNTAMPTGALSANSCSSAITVAASGVTASMHITWNLASSPVGVVGYGNNPLTINAWLTRGNVNFIQCATTAVTPGSMSLNWVVTN